MRQIYELNSRIPEEEREIFIVTQEIEYYKNKINQLQRDPTIKSVLDEGENWKALVDSINEDRNKLIEELETYKDKFGEIKIDENKNSEQSKIVVYSLINQ